MCLLQTGGEIEGAGRLIRASVRAVEDWWFDATRGVQTAGDVPFAEAGALVGQVRDGVNYIPARVSNARAALRDLPVRDVAGYTFVDLGSGKGRMLFVAAELGFRRVVGVEFSAKLHEQSVANVGRYRGRERGAIETVLGNALDYAFPAGPLVVYLFNPFGAETMRKVLGRLEESLRETPRHVVVVLLWPENGALVAAMEGMRCWRATRRFQVYEAGVEERRR